MSVTEAYTQTATEKVLRTYVVQPTTAAGRTSAVLNQAGETVYSTEIHKGGLKTPGLLLFGTKSESHSLGAVSYPHLAKHSKLGFGDYTSSACVWEDIEKHIAADGSKSWEFGLTIPDTNSRLRLHWRSASKGRFDLFDSENILIARFRKPEIGWGEKGTLDVVSDIGGNDGDLVILLSALGVVEKLRRSSK